MILDLDGCLYVGERAVPGAGDALLALVEAGVRVILATNNSTRTAAQVAARIARIVGVEVDPALIVTSAMAAASMVGAADRPALLVGERGLTDTFVEAGIDLSDDPAQAGSVVVGLDRHLSYERLRSAAHAVQRGARFIGTNPDPTFPTAGLLDPGAGAIVAAVARAGGRQPEFAGKPFLPMLDLVAALVAPGPTWVVGDRAETDLAFGVAAGWTTVLVLTGVTDDPGTALPVPDHVLESVSGLARLVLHT